MVSVVFQTHHYQNASHYILRLPTNLQYPFDNGTWIMLFVIIYSYEAALQSYTIFLNSVVCLRFSTDTFIIATSEYPRGGFLVLLHIRCVPYNSLPNAPAKDALHALYQHHKRKGTTNLGNTYQQSENVWDRWHLFELLENVSRRQATSAVHR